MRATLHPRGDHRAELEPAASRERPRTGRLICDPEPVDSDQRTELTERKLLHGWASGSGRVSIRLAAAADLAAITRLLPAAEIELDDNLAAAIEDGTIGEAHRIALGARGPEHGPSAFVHAMAEQFTCYDVKRAYLAASLVLVADHRDSGVIGTIVSYPPPHVVGEVAGMVTGIPSGITAAGVLAGKQAEKMFMIGAIGLAKVQAIAVDQTARRGGIGAALLSRLKRSTSTTATAASTVRCPTGPACPSSTAGKASTSPSSASA